MVFYECAFRLKGLPEEPGTFNTVFEVILLAEIILIFFKTYPGDTSHEGWLFSVLRTCGLCKKTRK